MAKIAFVMDNMFEDSEFRVPYDRVKEAGHQPVIIGTSAGKQLTGMKGKERITTELGVKDASVQDFDALVIPGGYSPDHMRRCRPMVDLVIEAARLGKVLAAICHGPWMLCSARCLKGRKVTGFFAIRDDVENAGGIWEDAACVRDGNLVTSRTPDDLPAFMQGVLAALAEPARA